MEVFRAFPRLAPAICVWRGVPLDFGPGLKKKSRVFAGRESYVVVPHPNLAIPPVVLVGEFSQVDSEPEI